MSGVLLLTYALIAGIFAYLAIQLDEEHGEFKLLNLGISYITLIVTTLFAGQYVKVEYPDSDLAAMVQGMGGNYSYLLMFILGYFVVYVLYKVLKDMVEL